jgi:CelD/BcsL family acetyltransferase involved in cellulose biosynthesis
VARDSVVSALLAYLAKHRQMWDLIEIRDVLAESPTLPILERLCDRTRGIRLRRQARTEAPYLSLTGTWEDLVASKRSKFRSNLKYYLRLPERSGQRLTIDRIAVSDSDEVVDVLAGIELRSWKARDGNLKINTSAGREFYRRFCRNFGKQGWLHIWRADLDGRPVAFLVNIVYGQKCYHYNTSYEKESAYFSPGLLMHAEALADAFRQGLKEYDFLSGAEPYKMRWCSRSREIQHVVVFHQRPLSLLGWHLLVHGRWIARRSAVLRRSRQRVLRMLRQVTRRPDRREATRPDEQ